MAITPPVVIERTDKRIKRWKVAAALLIVAGAVTCSFDAARMGTEGDPNPSALAISAACWIIGLALWVRAGISAWWHHG